MVCSRVVLIARSILAIAGPCLVSGSAAAHHSAAMFDTTKCLGIKGTVRTFQFQNPHSWLWVEVPNQTTGTTAVWGFENAAPSNLIEIDKHWSRDVLKKGDKVTVHFSPLKDGRTGGLFIMVALPDGSVLKGTPVACRNLKDPYAITLDDEKATAAAAAGDAK